MSRLHNVIIKTNDNCWQITISFTNGEINLEKNSKDEPIFGEIIAFGIWRSLTAKEAAKLYDLLHLQEKLDKAYPHIPFKFSLDDIENEINCKEGEQIIKNSC